jgi:hypothetical protein
MTVLETFFARLSLYDGFVIADSHVHVLRYQDGRYVAVQGPAISSLERADRAVFRREIARYQSDFLREVFAVDSNGSSVERLRFPFEFAIKQVLPLVVGHGSRNEADCEKTSACIEEIINKESSGGADSTARVVALRDDLLGKLPPTRDIFCQEPPLLVWRRNVYILERDPNGFVALNGFVWSNKFQDYVANLESRYEMLVCVELKREALLACNVNDIAVKFKNSGSGLDNLIKKGEVCVNNAGVVVHGGSVYVYVRLPKFAMKNPLKPENYHPFGSVRVAVGLIPGEGSFSHYAGHFCIDRLVHPFANNPNSDFVGVCGEGIPVDNSAQSVARHLFHIGNLLMNGLTRKSLEKHGAWQDGIGSYYQKPAVVFAATKPLTKAQAVKEGYVIANEDCLK